MFYVYTIVIAECCYVGSTSNINGRAAMHLMKLARKKHHNYKLQAAFNKCGCTSLKFTEISQHVNRNDAFKAEYSLINQMGNKCCNIIRHQMTHEH